jgi:FdhD protein
MASVIAVCTSQKKGTKKKPVDEIFIKEGYGIDGDAHADCLTHRQVSLLATESVDKMRRLGFDLNNGDFAENITTLGIDLVSLPVGTRIAVGNEVILEMTQIGKECHAACAIRRQVGDCIMPREGIFARVVHGGVVKPGDALRLNDENGSLEWVECIKVNAAAVRTKERVVREVGLSISVNNKHLATAMITPAMEREFVAGYLFGQGLIGNAGDIASITLKGNVAEVILPEMKDWEKRSPEIRSGFKVSRQAIFDGVSAILKSALFAETEALHSAGLFHQDAEAICIAEDIGRHHALDKVIGYGLLNDIDFGHTFAASTGRQPSEMILRCLKANIPIIATKGVPTTLAIDLARKAGLTIAGLVRGDTMIVYANPDRIE